MAYKKKVEKVVESKVIKPIIVKQMRLCRPDNWSTITVKMQRDWIINNFPEVKKVIEA